MPTARTIYAAKLEEPGETPYWFVSLDGDAYLECNIDPRNATVKEVERLFAPRPTKGGGQMLVMRIARAFLRRIGAEFFDVPAAGKR